MNESVAALCALILHNGSPVRDESDRTLVYGWLDYDAEKHLREGCAATAISEPWGIYWSSFEDTYSENSSHDGVEVKFSCACGLLTDRVMRWEAALRDVFSAVPDDVREKRKW